MNSLSTFRKAPTNKAMGIEKYPLYGEYYGFFYATEDASLDGGSYSIRGVELVSQPLSPNWLKKEIAKLGRKYTWSSNNTCGIHIHVSRKWLTEQKAQAIYKFLQEIDKNDFERLFGRTPNDYCRTYHGYGVSRYNAINNQPAATIEMRMFASGGPEWACYCVDMAKYLVEQWSTLNIDAALAFRALYPDNFDEGRS
jgi:hypothetical protein